jgi:APA family basic amino acid/polyamine antiporter
MNATILTGVIAGLMSGFASLEALHHTVSIGTLFAFVVVAASVLIIRYKKESNPERSVMTVMQLAFGMGIFCFGMVHAFTQPLGILSNTIHIGSFAFQWVQLTLMLTGIIMMAKPLQLLFTWRAVSLPSTFRCPWVPLLPILAMFGNICMMMFLNIDAWIRLWVWLGVGIILYVFYGRLHSKLNR